MRTGKPLPSSPLPRLLAVVVALCALVAFALAAFANPK